MKPQSNQNKLNNSFVTLQDSDWLHKQRVAGQCLVDVMKILQQLIVDKTELTMLEIDKIVDNEITKRGCYPTFKNFKGFPNALCLSVNKELVHGIPKNEKFKEGDVISFDFGATYEGAITDSAITVIYGEPVKQHYVDMISATQLSLYNAIKSIAVGKRIGVIGDAIYKTATNAKFNVITKFGGHGIGWNKPHADLFVPNKSNPDDGIVIQPGLTIAIEPLLVPPDCDPNKTSIGEDGWTISTDDIGAHFEHTLFIHKDHVEIMTWREEESNSIDKMIYFKS